MTSGGSSGNFLLLYYILIKYSVWSPITDLQIESFPDLQSRQQVVAQLPTGIAR
jgi:hypothetical protein